MNSKTKINQPLLSSGQNSPHLVCRATEIIGVVYPIDDIIFDRLIKISYEKKMKICPKCGFDFNYRRVRTRRSYQCVVCYNQIYPTAGTIFEKTITPLFYWLQLLCEYANTENNKHPNLMAYKRKFGVTYKTVWRMGKKIKEYIAKTEKKDIEELTKKIQISDFIPTNKHLSESQRKRRREYWYNNESYIKQLLIGRENPILNKNDIPKELVITKRLQLKLKAEVRNAS
jgi:ssDNA-binding Zn-finger/Zn-ribbon topoisomerase 1